MITYIIFKRCYSDYGLLRCNVM